jgi:hypothetical protein
LRTAFVVVLFLYSKKIYNKNHHAGIFSRCHCSSRQEQKNTWREFDTMKLLAFSLALTFFLLVSPAKATFADGGHGGSDDSEVKLTGAVESLPASGFVGDWRVAGRTVHVTSSTEINQEDGRITVGAIVKVEGAARADNSIDAREIELRQGASGSGGGQGGDDSQDDFKGTIQSFPAGFIGDWNIGGKVIHVTASTRIDTEMGPVAVGAFAEVHGTQRTDGSIDATKIEIKSNVAGDDGRNEINGTIERLPSGTLIGDWTVSGKTVHVTTSTTINQEHGAAAVGAMVEVQGTLRADGSLDATRIEVKTGASGGSGSSGSEGSPLNVKGAIERLPNSSDLTGDWVVKGTTVHVISSTKIKSEHGAIAIGTRVKIKGLQMADGSVVATKVQVMDN